MEHNLRVRTKVPTGRQLQLGHMVQLRPASMLPMIPGSPGCFRQIVHLEILESRVLFNTYPNPNVYYPPSAEPSTS